MREICTLWSWRSGKCKESHGGSSSRRCDKNLMIHNIISLFHDQDNYQFAYFLRKTAPNPVLLKVWWNSFLQDLALIAWSYRHDNMLAGHQRALQSAYLASLWLVKELRALLPKMRNVRKDPGHLQSRGARNLLQ